MSGAREPWVFGWVAMVAYLFYHFLSAVHASPHVRYVFAGIAIFGAVMAAAGLVSAIRFHRLIAFIRKPSGLHGRIAFPRAEDADELGLSFSNPNGDGIPVGGVGDKILYWDGKGHFSGRAPTNEGKTESESAPMCLALGAHRHLIVFGKGIDLPVMTGLHRTKIGQHVIYVDPWRQLKRHGLPSHDFNPVQHLVALAEADDPVLVDKARAVVLVILPDPQGGAQGENRIFRSQGRDLLVWVLCYLAWLQSDTGELVCHFGYLHHILSGSPDNLLELFESMRRCPALDGAIARAGGRLLGKMDRSEKFFESMLTEALDAIAIFEPSGALAKSCEYSSFDPRDIKNPDKPTSIYFVIPPELAHSHGVFLGICLNTLAEICIEADSFEPRVTIIADEFASMSEGKIPSILPILYLGRSRGVQLITFVQDTGIYDRYGKESSAFTTQAEIVMCWGIRSTKDAEEYSKRSGKRAVVEESGSVPLSGLDGTSGHASFGLHQKGISYLRPDEFMQLETFTAALFYKQNPPIIVDLVSYRSVDPWRYQVRPVPGAPPAADLPVKYKA